jgi:hypothetical protein
MARLMLRAGGSPGRPPRNYAYTAALSLIRRG